MGNRNCPRHNRIGILSMAVLTLAAVFACLGHASAQPSGDEVVANLNARDDGTSLTRDMLITLTDKRGKTRKQETRTFRRYYEGEKRSTIFYVEPANIKDTGFLTFDYFGSDKDDDQWLYIPELRRVRRISSSNRGDYFLGTDFTYEDMKLDTRLAPDDYTWTVTGTEDVDGASCHILEGIPINEQIAEELGYGKCQAYVDSEYWFQRKTEAWDVNGNHIKTVIWNGWHQVDDIWVVASMHATNHKTSHSTLFEFKNVDLKTEIPDDMFSENALRRGVRSN